MEDKRTLRMDEFSSDEFFTNVLDFLKDGKEDDAAFVLQLCEREASNFEEMIDTRWGIGPYQTVFIRLGCHRLAYDILSNGNHPVTKAIEYAIQAILSGRDSEYHINHYVVPMSLGSEDVSRLSTLWDQPIHALRTPPRLSRPDVFIVYGHDDAARFELAHYLETDLRIHAIMLDQHQPKSSNTIIEELEQQTQTAGYAVVLVTSDDLGALQGASELEPRARQNVIYEAGYFHGLLGRERVLIMKKGDVNIPSDLDGILYVPMDKAGGWKGRLREKLAYLGLLESEAT